MNLTLWTYQPDPNGNGFVVGQKELFYEIINLQFTKPNNPKTFNYTIPNTNFIQTPPTVGAVGADISIAYSSSTASPSLNEYA
jgi:hypothetical protein